MSVSVTLNTPLAEQLSNVVQPKLVEVGWSTGISDDSALAEYIILMLVNGKTQEQIAVELSNDLLNLGPDDSGALDFSRWLFEQVELLGQSLNDATTASFSHQDSVAHVIPISSGEGDAQTSTGVKREVNGAESQDAEMTEAMEGVQGGNIPTGPKSMRNGPRQGNNRLIGQLSKAMDRSSDSVLHRVRSQHGSERISMHNRQPPRGPRGDNGRGAPFANGAPTGPSHRPSPNRGPAGIPQMSSQQQLQLLKFYEQQAKMMSQILSPQQQQMLMPHVPALAINPAFRDKLSFPNQQTGKSLFDRVERNPHRQTGAFNSNRPHQNRPPFPRIHHDTEMGNDDVSSSMEVESLQKASELSPDTICKFNLSCTKPDCIFAHQSPAAPPGTTIDVNDECPFGAACLNRKCVARHPSPSQKKTHQSEQDCKFYPNCTNTKCPFRHPSMPMCRNGADCTTDGCKFTHVKTMCRFNPCLNSSCFYKHEEGQKRGNFDDKVWKAEGSQERGHVSERKFVVKHEEGDEELIIPGNQAMGGSQSSLGAEVVT